MGATSPDKVSDHVSTYIISVTRVTSHSRLRTILDSTGPNNRYAISRVPRDCVWPAETDHSKLTFNDVPVIVVVLGTLRSFSFEVDADADECTATVSLDLFRDVDRAAHARLKTAHHHTPGTSLCHREYIKTDTHIGQEHTYVTARTTCKGAQKVRTLRDTHAQH